MEKEQGGSNLLSKAKKMEFKKIFSTFSIIKSKIPTKENLKPFKKDISKR